MNMLSYQGSVYFNDRAFNSFHSELNCYSNSHSEEDEIISNRVWLNGSEKLFSVCFSRNFFPKNHKIGNKKMSKLVFVLIGFIGVVLSQNCPCANVSLCDNIKTIYDKELFGFGGDNSTAYNWTYITTMAWADEGILCEAHSHGVRLISSIDNSNIPFTNSSTERLQWIKSQFEYVKSIHFDGMTFDYESPMKKDDIKSIQYTQLINETTIYFHENMPGSQISVCVAWSAYNIDGRYYDYKTLSEVSDLLYIMDYDTQSQIPYRQCIASANAPFPGTQYGLDSFINILNIDPYKLILGVPWYGYNYTCDMSQMESIKSKYCPIPFIPFRGYNCSDAAGKEYRYSYIMKLIDDNKNITDIIFDPNTNAPFFNALNNDGNVNQYWYDNPQSLSLKYKYAKDVGLRGIGPFTFNDLIYTNSINEQKRAQQMWSAFDNFFIS